MDAMAPLKTGPTSGAVFFFFFLRERAPPFFLLTVTYWLVDRTCTSGQWLEETRRTLEALYAQFTEGFDTPDLQAAKALLDQWQITIH